MKKIALPFLIASTLLFSAFTAFNAAQWKIAEDYSIKFSSKDPSGVFNSLKGEIVFDPNDLAAARFDVVVDVNSINTGNGMKNKHAKSEKWFDAAIYPDIKFKSNKVLAIADAYQAVGVLEIHGISKEFTMPFTFANSTFKSSFDVNRLDFNVGTTEGMSAKVPPTLKVDVTVPVTR